MRRYAIAMIWLVVMAPAGTRACTCSKVTPGECPRLQQSDVVFLGTALDISTASPAGATAAGGANTAPVTRYHFRVDERFAGSYASEIDVYSGGDDGDCGYRFKKGESYVVFTQQETEGRLFSTICNGTRPASEGRALIPQLRAMRNGDRVASVFGLLHRADPPFLEPTDDPDDPLPHIKLKLRSKDDRFATSTGPDGVYSFYDVHAGEYQFTADLPARFEFTQKTLKGGLPPFKIPDGACFEYNVEALPTGKIRGSVLGPNGKPLSLASVELFRADRYEESRPGLWGFQDQKGSFEFDHIGPGEYIVVFNRMNRMDPNSPYERTFYPGTSDVNEAKKIGLKDGQGITKANIKLHEGYPTRTVRVHLAWTDGKPPGEVTVMVRADKGDNPAAQKIGDGLYEFTLIESASYTISAWEDLDPTRTATRHTDNDCTIPARIAAPSVAVSGSEADAKEVTLLFAAPGCEKQNQ